MYRNKEKEKTMTILKTLTAALVATTIATSSFAGGFGPNADPVGPVTTFSSPAETADSFDWSLLGGAPQEVYSKNAAELQREVPGTPSLASDGSQGTRTAVSPELMEAIKAATSGS